MMDFIVLLRKKRTENITDKYITKGTDGCTVLFMFEQSHIPVKIMHFLQFLQYIECHSLNYIYLIFFIW